MCSKFSVLLVLRDAMGVVSVKSLNLKSAFAGAAQFVVYSPKPNSPRGWWSLKLPEGRMRRKKLLQLDKYPRQISLNSPEGESYATDHTC